MLITGKISEENHIFLIMKKNNVLNGKQRILFKHMQMVVNMNIDVNFLMAGKNKNIILSITKCMHVDRLNSVKNHIARTTTQNKIKDNK